ncbi:hypothetical protein IP68_04760 [Blastomonas sp. AAP25]|uniref:hypothetical protein n=1 Tax=Blastomonas sp. AAP25 TaxID=1523416 RepID=UPI0006B9FD5A|nr:hypothetical protein [Blastomonas sp. AAP25]KPF75851.1 hypothetical protein IP68_04760 [Blastomonas sp. AAP25]
MIAPAIRPLVRRAIIDLLAEIGGEHNDHHLATLLAEVGHRVARRDVAEELRWLAQQRLIRVEAVDPYVLAEILPDGEDVAASRLIVEGIYRHKTGR